MILFSEKIHTDRNRLIFRRFLFARNLPDGKNQKLPDLSKIKGGDG